MKLGSDAFEYADQLEDVEKIHDGAFESRAKNYRDSNHSYGLYNDSVKSSVKKNLKKIIFFVNFLRNFMLTPDTRIKIF